MRFQKRYYAGNPPSFLILLAPVKIIFFLLCLQKTFDSVADLATQCALVKANPFGSASTKFEKFGSLL